MLAGKQEAVRRGQIKESVSHCSSRRQEALFPRVLEAEQSLLASAATFQSGSWHFGNGTRTWGETYGIKLGRLYLGIEVKHTNPRISVTEAGDDL